MEVEYLCVMGGNEMAVPSIKRLKEHKHKLLIIDGNPEAPAKNEADIFINQSFTDLNRTRNKITNFKLTGIIPLNDFAVPSAAAIARERHLPGWTIFSEKCLTDKIEMKKIWQKSNLPTAKAVFSTVDKIMEDQSIPGWDTWPSIVKPSYSGGGSRGVFLAHSWSEVIKKLKSQAQKFLDGKVIIEEFLTGSEHTLEVLLFNGKSK